MARAGSAWPSDVCQVATLVAIARAGYGLGKKLKLKLTRRLFGELSTHLQPRRDCNVPDTLMAASDASDDDYDQDTESEVLASATTNCASDAFATLHALKPLSRSSLSSPTSTVSKTGERPFTNFLPVELLLNIFWFVYAMSIQTPESPHSKSSIEWKNEDSLSPSLFPYAIASVCSSWRDVMLMIPAFWTRIVILVDTLPTPLSMIECQLAWTRDLPLDLTLTRRVASRTLGRDDPHEKAQVDSVIAIIVPQLHRCHKLRINVSLSSSLPAFPWSFHGGAPLLEELQLECDFDDGGPDAVYGLHDIDTTMECQFPALWKLVLDGPNFDNIYEDGDNWSKLPNLTSLAISRKNDHPYCSPDRLLSTLCHAPNLTHLRLTGLDLDCEDDEEDDPISPISLYSLVLEDVGGASRLGYFIGNIEEIVNLTLTRCTTGRARFTTETLTLKEIDDDIDNLDTILWLWSGDELCIDSCPGFDDEFLDRMCVVRAYGVIAPMSFLTISNCVDFSVPALKRFVESRYTILYGDDCPAFVGIRISGDSPSFSPEDILWFKERLTHFSVEGE